MKEIIDQFPILKVPENGKRLVYLDNAATTQRPYKVLDKVCEFYRLDNANPHRGAYDLGQRATDRHEGAREETAKFINAVCPDEIVFTQNCSEALNLVAYGYGITHIGEGDEILLAVSEHHSNIVPWQRVALSRKARLRYLYPDEYGRYTEEEISSKINSQTRIVAIAHVSNVLGAVNPIDMLVEYAHRAGAVVVLDCAQSIAHMKIDVQKSNVDFAAFSGHKMYAPMGIGVLYGKKALLEETEPMLSGGDMISQVHENCCTWAEVPRRFETGTRNVGGEVGLKAAIEFIREIGYKTIEEHEDRLMQKALSELNRMNDVIVYGDTKDRKGVLSFNIKDVHPHDVATILDNDGVTIRAGHHCAQPLMEYLKCGSCCRASFAVYNTFEDVDMLIEGIKNVRRWMGIGS